MEVIEDGWWPVCPPVILTYTDIPSTSKWTGTIRSPSPSLSRHLEIRVDGKVHIVPTNWVGISMLLDFNQLACLSCILRIPKGPESIRYHKTIAFVDSMRKHILESATPQEQELPHLIRRWLQRLINGHSNSSTDRLKNLDVLKRIYDQDKNSVELLQKVHDWAQEKRNELVEVAKGIYKNCLCQEMRGGSSQNPDSFANNFVQSLIFQLEIDKTDQAKHPGLVVELPAAHATKRGRGRPRKTTPVPPQEKDQESMVQTRTMSKINIPNSPSTKFARLAQMPAMRSPIKKGTTTARVITESSEKTTNSRDQWPSSKDSTRLNGGSTVVDRKKRGQERKRVSLKRRTSTDDRQGKSESESIGFNVPPFISPPRTTAESKGVVTEETNDAGSKGKQTERYIEEHKQLEPWRKLPSGGGKERSSEAPTASSIFDGTAEENNACATDSGKSKKDIPGTSLTEGKSLTISSPNLNKIQKHKDLVQLILKFEGGSDLDIFFQLISKFNFSESEFDAAITNTHQGKKGIYRKWIQFFPQAKVHPAMRDVQGRQIFKPINNYFQKLNEEAKARRLQRAGP